MQVDETAFRRQMVQFLIIILGVALILWRIERIIRAAHGSGGNAAKSKRRK